MSPNAKARAEFAGWLTELIKNLPASIGLIYVEWNGCCDATGSEGWIEFFTTGYERTRLTDFDPEDPEHLGELSRWDWENSSSCVIPKVEIAVEDINDFILNSALRDSELAAICATREVQVAYGQHDSETFCLPSTSKMRSASQKGSKRFCYELHDRLLANSIVRYDLGSFDETPLLNSCRVEQPWPADEISFFLEENARPTDLLCSNRWMICSKRLTKLFLDSTGAVQTFSAPVYLQLSSGKELLRDYFVVNLYEKLDCIPDEYLKPSAYAAGGKTFDCGKGYKLHWPAIAGKDVFRLNCEYFRLLVSQKLRDEFDKQNITGVTWLKRAIVD